MTEPGTATGSGAWRWLRIVGLVLALCVLTGFATGYLVAHVEHGGGFGARILLVVGAALLGIAGCVWQLLRDIRALKGEGALTPRERLNRNLMIGSGALGVVIAILLIAADEVGVAEGGNAFSNAPLPPALALVLVLLIGVIIPILTIYWHRIIDEQEADAVKTGALFGAYVYLIGAPVWWLAWRGGFAPEPNGFIIYFASGFTMAAIWLWRKHR